MHIEVPAAVAEVRSDAYLAPLHASGVGVGAGHADGEFGWGVGVVGREGAGEVAEVGVEEEFGVGV